MFATFQRYIFCSRTIHPRSELRGILLIKSATIIQLFDKDSVPIWPVACGIYTGGRKQVQIADEKGVCKVSERRVDSIRVDFLSYSHTFICKKPSANLFVAYIAYLEKPIINEIWTIKGRRLIYEGNGYKLVLKKE